MEQDGSDAEALRRRLYRPGASAEDLDSYLDAAGPLRAATPGPPGPRARSRPGRRRVHLVVVAAAIVVALPAAAAVGTLARTPSSAPVAVTSPLPSAPPSTGRRASSAVLDGGSRPNAAGRAERRTPHGYLYTVARGDTVIAIAERFRLCAADVYGALPYGADASALPPEQQLLLEGHLLDPAEYAVPGAC